MRIKTLYGIVVEKDNGGQTLDSFLKKESALQRSEEIINHIKKNDIKNIKVYLSELDYDLQRNLLLSNKLINRNSKLLFSN